MCGDACVGLNLSIPEFKKQNTFGDGGGKRMDGLFWTLASGVATHLTAMCFNELTAIIVCAYAIC